MDACTTQYRYYSILTFFTFLILLASSHRYGSILIITRLIINRFHDLFYCYLSPILIIFVSLRVTISSQTVQVVSHSV